MIDKLNPKITIITVSFNAVSTIEETIKSVINQSYSNIEYIIIDGGSTDGTVDIIEHYNDKIAYWVSEPDKGIYDAMNKGINIATGEYIHFLNASDIYYSKDTVYQIINYIPQQKPDVIYGKIIIDKQTEYIYMKPALLYKFIYSFPVYHPSTWVKTSLMKKNMFDLNFKIAADWNFLRKIYYQNASFYYVPIIFSIFEGVNGISSKKSDTQDLEIKIIQNTKYFKSPKFIFDYIRFKFIYVLNKFSQSELKDTRIIKIEKTATKV